MDNHETPKKLALFGVINIHKPKGLTSHDVVARLRKIFNMKKIGHLGTLDPMATGVLPVCLGNATRLIEHFPNEKAYKATFALGYETTTLDAEGDKLPERTAEKSTIEGLRTVTKEAIETLLASFLGEQQQKVPRFSAVHVQGKKLYHYAHQGIIIPDELLPVKAITIHALKLINWEAQAEFPTLTVQVACSSGTYIRSLVRDIAEKLGTFGTLTELVRTHHGRFALETSVEIETLKEAEDPTQWLIKPFEFLPFPQIVLPSAVEVALFFNGMPLEESQFTPPAALRNNQQFQVFTSDGEQFLGLAQWHTYKLRPEKVFHS
jgi:tRNA pseudouridine55 synthase